MAGNKRPSFNDELAELKRELEKLGRAYKKAFLMDWFQGKISSILDRAMKALRRHSA